MLSASASFRLGFCWSLFLSVRRFICNALHRCFAPNPAFRDPENFQCRAVFIQFPDGSLGERVQPVFDSRHGRIACITSFSQSVKSGESRLVQSVKRAYVQPLSWLAAALPKRIMSFS